MKAAEPQFYFAELPSGLQNRVVVAPFPPSEQSWQIVFLRSGSLRSATIDDDGERSPIALQAPAFLCQPVNPLCKISLNAGSNGVHLAVDEIAMSAALGGKPESVELRIMAAAGSALSLAERPQVAASIWHSLEAISREMELDAPGQQTVIEAQLRCMLIHLWRHSYQAMETLSSDGPQTILLRRFRQLVETNYRKRWRVADYADALGTTSDRLHNLATGSLGRTPLYLIHDRSQREAKALLSRSNMSVEQISDYLGFNSPAQFSAFFRKLENEPPGRFRIRQKEKAQNTPESFDAGIPDWP